MNRLRRLLTLRDTYAARGDAYGSLVCRVIDRITLQSSIRYGTRGRVLP